MNSTNSIDKALILTATRFQGVVDELGEPYILHCLRVMMSFSDPVLQQVGLMHDLLEDTSVTIAELREVGFDEEVITAIELLTRTTEDSYANYIRRLKSNSIAKRVKLADLRDNSDVRRALYRAKCPEKDSQQAGRYILSYQYLEDRIGEAEYLRLTSPLEPSP